MFCAMKLLILTVFCCIINIECNDIIGCGGFIRTDIKGFSYNKLSAHLTFSDGTLNYVTDILPNGAYSVPIYDFGNYIIKIVGPKGWSIEPVEGYQLVVNSHDACTEDYNFKFTGFSVIGKVSTAYINHGPPGILIDLVMKNNIISQASTVDGGGFQIVNVMPGNYSLNFKSETVDGKTLELNDTTFDFEVSNDNIYIKDSFIIYGYPVFGDIKFYEEPVQGVEFYLFSNHIDINQFNFSKYKCVKVDDKTLEIDGYSVICKTLSDLNGSFIFPLLPGGNYLLVPVYQTTSSLFDLYPNRYEFEIKSNSVDLRSIFRIMGFSIVGKVVGFDSNPIPKVEIYVDGNSMTKSSFNGSFLLKGMKKGKHEISLKLDGFVFNKTTVELNPKMADIGEFRPEKTSICGSIIISKSQSVEHETNELYFRRKIELINENGEVIDFQFIQIKFLENLQNNENPKTLKSIFCFYVRPGTYLVRPVNDPPMFSLAPNQIKVVLVSSPVFVKFSPFRGSATGIVKCIEKCTTGEFEVSLKSANDDKESVLLTQHISISNEVSNQGTFQFKDIVPGSYFIELVSANSHIPLNDNRWCWSQNTIAIDIMDSNVNGLIFEQTGFSLPIRSTHDLQIIYFHSDNPNTSIGSKSLSKGISKICLPKSGKYEIRINMCHKLENKSYFFDISQVCEKNFDFHDPKCQIEINVTEFKVRVDFEFLGHINADDVENLKTSVTGILNLDADSKSIVKDIEWNNNKGFLYFWVRPDVPVKVNVNSTKYLVMPKEINFKLPKDTTDCVTEIGTFTLERGTFINGSVSPSLKGVSIEIRKKISSLDEDDIESIVGFSETDDSGHFSVGPLNSSFDYDLKLFKKGYKIIKNTSTVGENHFNAFKLSELIVEVVDNITGKALSGILLSIVGDDLRKNELTNENGQFTFVGLTPGVYYLRAMMKELDFIPNGAVEVLIKEGSLQKILIRAARTSFSLYGKVVSLNGEPEVGIIVEGNPSKDSLVSNDFDACKTHLFRSEHATTDETGAFRIRGLHPGCYYKLTLKNVNTNEDGDIVRSYPNNITVKMLNKDFHNVKIYALRNLNVREISVIVWTNDDIYRASLHLLVFPSNNPDNVIAVHKFINEGIYFQMSLPSTPKKIDYVIRLQSNLSPNLFTNISAQERILRMEDGDLKSIYKHFEFHFNPVKKPIGDTDPGMTLTSSLLLPLVMIVFSVLFFHKGSLEPIVYKCTKMVRKGFLNTFKHSSVGLSSNTGMKSAVLDPSELSELNNAVAKSKPVTVVQPVKKTPFWSRPKKA